MEWTGTMTIEFKNEIANKAVDALKAAIKAGDYDNKYKYKRNVSDDLCMALDEGTEGNKIEIFDSFDMYNPYDVTQIMKDVLTGFAKALGSEPFSCSIDSSGTYDESEIDAKYDGRKLLYSYTYGEIGWNMLEYDECGYDEEIEEYNDDGIYRCPECGAKIINNLKHEKKQIEIIIG